MGSFSAGITGTTEVFGTSREASGVLAAVANISYWCRREATASNTMEQSGRAEGEMESSTSVVHERKTAKTECQNYYDHPNHHWSKDPLAEENKEGSYMGVREPKYGIPKSL